MSKAGAQCSGDSNTAGSECGGIPTTTPGSSSDPPSADSPELPSGPDAGDSTCAFHPFGIDETWRTHLAGLVRRAADAVCRRLDHTEVPELAGLPPEVRRLVHAVDRIRDNWAESNEARRGQLRRDMHAASDAVWGRLDRVTHA